MGKGILWFIVPFCSIFMIAGGGIMLYGLLRIVEGCRATSRPTTVGTILTRLSKDTSGDDGNSREIVVTYAYTVDGRDFVGTVIHPCYMGSSFEEAHRGLEAQLEPGRKVRVRYLPDDPQRSVLATGFFSGTLTVLAFGGVFFGAGLGFLLIFLLGALGNWNFVEGIEFVDPPK